MEKETLEPSLRYLTDAAHLLAQTAPETSAHLMARRNDFMFENNLELSDRQREHICGSCGHIMVPGAGDVLKLETDKAIRKSRRNKGAAAAKPDAKKAGRVSGVRLPTPGSNAHANVLSAQASEPTKAPPSANASSKKRAKNRKQGLQALLQSQASTAAPKVGLGLSLADFMKK
ncbi:uncharacterized protein PG998_010172 [Apiospora kogelbergensis]|uniref:uncharacterized protein n=1 Tax=Apiospora kogelbergensis TaxID=1337665 RepID=UPI00312E1B63